MKSNLQLRRFHNAVIAIFMASLLVSAGITFPRQISVWEGVYFAEELPILGNFAVVDWIGIFFALTFLSGWILFSITTKMLGRVSIFRWPTGILPLFLTFFILSMVASFFLDISVEDTHLSELIQSGFYFFFSGAVISAFVIFSSDLSSVSK